MARRRHSSPGSRTGGTGFLRRWLLWLNLGVAVLLGGWYFTQPGARQLEVRQLVGAAFERGKQVSALDVAWDLWQLYYANPGSGRLAARDKTHVYGGAPVAVRGAEGGTIRVLVNQGYVVGYSNERGSPLWAAYHLRDLPNLPSAPRRPDSFSIDRRTTARVSAETYTGSGYDRGHLAPNFAIATYYGAAAQAETFLMSNITPQRHLLNAGLWKELEQKIATNYPARYREIWVLTGPIFGARPSTLPGGAQIPEAFFLIVVDEHEGKLRTLALIVPQDAPTSAAPDRYLTTIDEIERRTQLDFLADLDDESEQAIERVAATKVW